MTTDTHPKLHQIPKICTRCFLFIASAQNNGSFCIRGCESRYVTPHPFRQFLSDQFIAKLSIILVDYKQIMQTKHTLKKNYPVVTYNVATTHTIVCVGTINLCLQIPSFKTEIRFSKDYIMRWKEFKQTIFKIFTLY